MKNYRRAKSILCIVLIVCYAVGMVCMFVNAFPIGLALWAVSLVGGLAVLYRIRVEKNKAAEAERLKKAGEDGDDEACE